MVSLAEQKSKWNSRSFLYNIQEVAEKKGITMQRRAFLLFVLFVVLAAFYVSATRENVPVIAAKQQEQTERFNQLDEQVLNPQGKATESTED